jgi:hypothetical protein
MTAIGTEALMAWSRRYTGPTAVGHALTAGGYDRRSLERLYAAEGHMHPAIVGVEVGVSLLECELKASWTARRRSLRQEPADEQRRRFAVSHIRGLVACLRALSEGGPLRHRRPSLPPCWGRR